MQEALYLLIALGIALLGALLFALFLNRKFPFFNFLEWFGAVFLLVGWYSLFIPSTLEFVTSGNSESATQALGFIAANLFPFFVLSWAVYRRRKTHKSQQVAGDSQP